VYADLRELPYRDAQFDTVVCVSTLDHVGMDNAFYGSDAGRSADPAAEADRVVGELVRVLAPGGRLLLTVPFGVPEDLGWLRQFDAAGVERIVAAAAGLTATVEVFAYGDDGWQRSSLQDAADCVYHEHPEGGPPDPGGVVAARAVACLRLERP
jgi:SAM-dependent methyltransferase